MRGLQNALLFLISTCATGLIAYEVTAHSDALFGRPLPGWFQARQADRAVGFAGYTRIAPLDRLVHEGQEAVAYYSILLR